MATIIFEGKCHQVRPTVVAKEQPRYIVNTKLAKNQSVEIIFPDILIIHKKMLKMKKKVCGIHLSFPISSSINNWTCCTLVSWDSSNISTFLWIFKNNILFLSTIQLYISTLSSIYPLKWMATKEKYKNIITFFMSMIFLNSLYCTCTTV